MSVLNISKWVTIHYLFTFVLAVLIIIEASKMSMFHHVSVKLAFLRI